MIAITLQRREPATFIFGVLLCYSACNFVAVFVHYISNIAGKHYSCQLYSFTIDRPQPPHFWQKVSPPESSQKM